MGACGDKKAKRRRDGDAGPSVVVVDRGRSGAALVAEKEPNDEAAAAQVVAVPGGVKGTIDAAGDVDRYTLTVAAPGTLALRLSGVADADLVLELEDSTGKKLAQSDNGPANVAEGVPNMTVTPGEYRVLVREFVKKPKRGQPAAKRSAPSAPYQLEATLGSAAALGEEVEPNEEAAFAGALAIGGAGTGYVGWRKDRDVWKVALEGAGEDEALAIDVDGVAEVALKVTVLDGTEAVLLERQGRAGEALALRNIAIRKEEPHFYVVVSGSRGNLDERYTVRATSAPFQLDEEEEPNDKLAQAGAISDVPDGDSGTRVGYLGRGDVDLFKLDAAAGPRTLHLTVEPPPGVDVELSVITADAGTPLAGPVNDGKRGASEKLSNVAVPAGAAVVVKLTVKSGASDTERYRLRWSAVPAEAAPDEPAPIPGMEE